MLTDVTVFLRSQTALKAWLEEAAALGLPPLPVAPKPDAGSLEVRCRSAAARRHAAPAL